MEQFFIDLVSKTGVAGFAIFIMYRMYLINVEWHQKKDAAHAAELREERDNFRNYSEKVRTETAVMLAKNTQVISDNTKVFSQVISHLQKRKRAN